MKTSHVVATLAILLAACTPDVGKGKSRATVATPPSAAAQTAPAKPEATTSTIQVDATRSRIAAVGAKVTRTHDIAFDKWSGQLKLSDGELAGVEVEIQMSSLRADVPKLTGHLQSPDFFDVEKFPTAKFSATEVVAKNGPNGATHVVTGQMTMHGVTKELSFPARVNVSKSEVSANAEFVIDRRDFEIVYPGMPDDLIKDDVALTIELTGNPGEA